MGQRAASREDLERAKSKEKQEGRAKEMKLAKERRAIEKNKEELKGVPKGMWKEGEEVKPKSKLQTRAPWSCNNVQEGT